MNRTSVAPILTASALVAVLAACADSPSAPPAAAPEAPGASLSALDDAFLTVSGGNSFTCGSTLLARVYCWGVNDNGELGQGDLATRAVPARVAVPAALGVSSGGDHACAAAVDGSAWCWGANYVGQLGDGTTTDSPVPVRVQAPAGVRFVAVTAGVIHTCALALDGSAWCWGDNGFGELGDGTGVSSAVPVRVQAPAGVRFRSVHTGDGAVHTCAISTTGAAWCWGDDSAGQLGAGAGGTTATAPVAVQVPAGVSFAAIQGAGFQHTCAVATNGLAWCWGDNSLGQLGSGTSASSAVPVRVASDERFASVAPGWFHTCGATLAAGARCWGDNFLGKLGNGESGEPSRTPVTVVGSQGFGRMDPGADHSCTRARDGRGLCWGRGSTGALGNGSFQDSATPVQVTPPGQVSPSVAPAPSRNRAGGDREDRGGLRRWCDARPDRARIAACA